MSDDRRPDVRLCVFAAPPKRLVLWQDKLVSKLNRPAPNAPLACRDFLNKLDDCLAPTKRCRPFVEGEALHVIKHADPVYRVGAPGVASKLNNNGLYFFDRVQIVKRVNEYGGFLTVSWPGLHRLNRAYAAAMQRHLNEPVVLQNVVFVNVPDDNNLIASTLFARKFFYADRDLNAFVYSTGRLDDDQSVLVRQLDRDWVRRHLKVNVRMDVIMGAVVEGVRRSNKQLLLSDLNNKAVSTNTFSLAVKPMIFIATD